MGKIKTYQVLGWGILLGQVARPASSRKPGPRRGTDNRCTSGRSSGRTPRQPGGRYGSAIQLHRTIAKVVSSTTRAVGPDGRIVVEWHSNGERMLLTVDKRPGFGLIRGGSDLSLRAAARDLKTYGGRIQYSRTRTGGTLAILVLRAFNG